MAENNVISEAQADFALKLLREVMSNNDGGDIGSSTILSPTSVAIALAMCYAGATDETAQEMGQLLANGAIESKVHEHFGALLRAIQLEGANKLYIKSGFPILDAFKTTIDRHYGGLFESVNFLEKAATAQKINDFMAQATHDKIKDLINEDMMDEGTRFELLEKALFNLNRQISQPHPGQCRLLQGQLGLGVRFDPTLTRKKPFYISEGNQIHVDMMSNEWNVHLTFLYSGHSTFQVLGIPYAGEHAPHLFIVLPRERFGLDQVLANLTGRELLELVHKRHKRSVIVSLPKFKLESTHGLNEPLKRLGIARAFDMQTAQFNGITAAEDEPLLISQVVQKALIDINEEGTEAGAPHSAAPFCGELPPTETKRFIADHPFAFFLVSSAADGGNQQQENNSQTVVLFNGIYSG